MFKEETQSRVQAKLREAFPDEVFITDEDLQAMDDYSRDLLEYYYAELKEFQDNREKAMDDLLAEMVQATNGNAKQEADLNARKGEEAKRLLMSICAMLGDGSIRENMEGSEARELLKTLAEKKPDYEYQLAPIELEQAYEDGVQNYIEAVQQQEEPGDMDGLYASAFYMGMLRGMTKTAALTCVSCLVALICAAVYSIGSLDKQNKLGRHCQEKMQKQLQGEGVVLQKELSGKKCAQFTRQNLAHVWNKMQSKVRTKPQQGQNED